MAAQTTTPTSDTKVTNDNGAHHVSTGTGAMPDRIAEGGWGGNGMANKIDSAGEHRFWRKHHTSAPHALDGLDFDSVEPAYRIGYSRYFDLNGCEQSFEMSEPDLRRDYEQTEAVLPWDKVRPAAQAAWMRVHDMQRMGASLLEQRQSFSLNSPPVAPEAIEVRAWFIYENGGYPQGRALDHWLQAEHEQQAHAAIALQAWLIYETQGYPQGHALDHWLQAEHAHQLQRLVA
jgi:hypothetical protein